MSTELLVAGGLEPEPEVAGLDVVNERGEQLLNLGYAAVTMTPGSNAYRVTIRQSLTAIVRRTERGWVATAPALNALGYGGESRDAVEDLLNSVEQYLDFLRHEAPELAPTVAHHADYLGLLDTPRSVWLAAVSVDASPLE